MDDLLNEINDKIVDSLKDSRLICIKNALFDNSDDNIFCNSISNFWGDTDINLIVQEGYTGDNLAITTGYLDSTDGFYGWIDITFNLSAIDDYCEITLYSTFLHEGIHAEMFRQNSTLNKDKTKAEIWNNWNNNSDHHNNIAKTYIPYMIESLKAEYGSRYSDTEYEAIAWLGLGNVQDENVKTEAWEGLSLQRKNELKDAFKDVNKDCSDDKCQ